MRLCGTAGHRWIRVVLGAGALLTGACTPALGECDEGVGERLVVDGEGRIMYAGQALLNGSCGAGRCHSESAEGDDRVGVPLGFDLALPVGTVNPLGRPEADFLERLGANYSTVTGHRSDIWREVHRGTMPPYDENVGGDAPGGYRYVEFELGRCSFGGALEAVDTSAGRTALRSWLACGAPVVEASDPALARIEEGAIGLRTPVCEDDSNGTGDLFTRVFDDVLARSCVIGCHTSGGTNPELDLSTPALAYMALTTQDPTIDDECDVTIANAMVDTADASRSYLLHKLGDITIPETERVICGKVMPSGQPYLTRGTASVRAWIEAGAPPPAP
ncbi:MAG: hypothetical protein R3B40_12400 [Polyangiales bacterium]|nr:hypothetical protein [Sandaracinaceae bacterium]